MNASRPRREGPYAPDFWTQRERKAIECPRQCRQLKTKRRARRASGCSGCSARRRARSWKKTFITRWKPLPSASSQSTRSDCSRSSGRSSVDCASKFPTRGYRVSRRFVTFSTRSRSGSCELTRRSEMAKETLKEQLRDLVAEITEKDEIPDGATFKELGIDSMMGVEIVAAIERQYQIKVEDDELADFRDLASAYALVVKKLEAKSATAAAE